MADLNEISAQEIGRRLRLARENAGFRQDDAAQIIEVSRPTLVSIEKGVRRVRMQELQKLAKFYGVSINSILRREAVHTDLVPRFRKRRESENEHTKEAIQLLNDLVKAEVELEIFWVSNVEKIIHQSEVLTSVMFLNLLSNMLGNYVAG